MRDGVARANRIAQRIRAVSGDLNEYPIGSWLGTVMAISGTSNQLVQVLDVRSETVDEVARWNSRLEPQTPIFVGDTVLMLDVHGFSYCVGVVARITENQPTLTPGVGAGSGVNLSYSVDATATDRGGRITLVTGSGVAPVAGIVFTVNFAYPRPNSQYTPRIDNADSDAAAQNVYMDFANRTVNGWTFATIAPLIANRSYHWWYGVRDNAE